HYLIRDVARETPHCVQLFGGDPAVMAQAARACVDEGADIIDINMGCPVRKVTKTGAGSALLCDTARAADVVAAIRRAVPPEVAVTAKLRAGWDADHINCVEMAQALQQAGCQAVALHARTRAQGYSGTADWDLIGRVKQAVRIPVIGNGDVVTVADAHAMQARTGCDGVMIGRGALGNPWIFQQLKQRDPTAGDGRPAGPQRLPVVLGHLRDHIALHRLVHQRQADPRTTREQVLIRALRAFRTHLVWYSTGLRGASLFRQRIMQLENLPGIVQAARAFFAAGDDSRSVAPQPSDAVVEAIDYRQAFG
ncbi:MAG: tRNA-dihydrouridine synthase, partial [Myxococcota bacterium]